MLHPAIRILLLLGVLARVAYGTLGGCRRGHGNPPSLIHVFLSHSFLAAQARHFDMGAPVYPLPVFSPYRYVFIHAFMISSDVMLTSPPAVAPL